LKETQAYSFGDSLWACDPEGRRQIAVYYCMATYTDSKEEKDRRTDGSITFVTIAWA